jgi:hypothetical protein
MNARTLSNWTLAGLILLFGILTYVNASLPQGMELGGTLPEAPPPLVMAAGVMAVYGLLALVGTLLARKLEFPELWEPGVSNRQRFLVPGVVGGAVGVLLIVIDQLGARLHSLGPLPHPPFPTSLVASASAAVGEELLFRLFFLTLWMWLLSFLFRKNRSVPFWIAAVLAAVAFAAAHLPSVMMLYGVMDPAQLPVPLLVELLLMNGAVALAAAYYFLQFGLLATIGIHFWTDIIWHVVWGLV